MFEPEKLLADLDLERMTAEQAIYEIHRIAKTTLPDMSSRYYEQRLGAIDTLARLAAYRRSQGWD